MECWKVRLSQKEEEVKEARALYEKLSGERERVVEIVRQEFADHLVSTEEEAKRLRRDLAETKARLSAAVERGEADVETAKREASTELNSLHCK